MISDKNTLLVLEVIENASEPMSFSAIHELLPDSISVQELNEHLFMLLLEKRIHVSEQFTYYVFRR